VSQQCRDHPKTAAAAACAGCADPFCEDCLVNVNGRTYCGSCKAMTIAGMQAPTAGTIPCEEANQALKLAVFGIFILGPILEPMALVKARQARRRIVRDTRLAGGTKVTIAASLAIAALVLWAITIASHLLVAVNTP